MGDHGCRLLGRRALRKAEVQEIYGAKRHAIERAIKDGRIRINRDGRCVYLHPDDVDSVFGFTEYIEPSAESVAELSEFLQ